MMPETAVKIEETSKTDAGIIAARIPLSVIVGYLMTLSLLVTPLLFSGDHLNQVTITTKVLAYILWTYTIMQVHRDVLKIDAQYPFGPKESMFGAWIPFSYIFWNFYWVSQLWRRLDLGFYSVRNCHYLAGLAAGLACVFCYPDNMDKIPNVMPVAGFTTLFTVSWIMLNQLTKLCIEKSVAHESIGKSI